MKILITGGAGFIGSHLVEHYQNRAEIVVLDNLHSGSLANLDGLKHTFIHGSITDRATVASAVRECDFVFHLGALVSVAESMTLPHEYTGTNLLGLLTVLEEAANAGSKKLIFASSAAIYGNNPALPKVETMAPEPESPYAITKLDGEFYLKIFHELGRIETASLRFFNVFGPRQNPKGSYAAAVPIFSEKAMRNEDISIFGDGEQTRDFIYVKDVVSALAFSAESPGLNGIFNVGYGLPVTINYLVHEILAATRSASRVIHQSERPGDVRHSHSLPGKLFAAGWCPRHSFSEGLSQTLEHLQKHQLPNS